MTYPPFITDSSINILMIQLSCPAQKISCWVRPASEQVGTASDGAKVALRVAVTAGEASGPQSPTKMVGIEVCGWIMEE